MKTLQTTATIIDGTTSHDISVPAGTTVSGMLSQWSFEAQGKTLVDEQGRRIRHNESFGYDLNSGCVLYLQPWEQAETTGQRWRSNSTVSEKQPIATQALWTVIISLLTLLSVLVNLGYIPLNSWGPHLGLAFVFLGFCVLVLRTYKLSNSVWPALLMPVPFGAALSLFIPHPELISSWTVPLSVLWFGTIVSFGLRFLRDHDFHNIVSWAWLISALLVSVSYLLQLTTLVFGGVLVGLGVYGLAFSGLLALRVPLNQTLDFVGIRSTVTAVRSPDIPSATRITPQRVNRTIRQADARRKATVAVSSLSFLIGSWLIAPGMNLNSIEGWSTVVVLVTGWLYLSLNPRTARDSFIRWCPRVVVAVSVTVVPGVSSLEFSSGLILLFLGLAVLLVGILLARDIYAPGWTRFADIVQLSCLGLNLPAVVAAAGAFTAMQAM